MKLRAYLVDDEPLALERMQRLLEGTGRVDVTGSTTEPERAVAALTSDPPDVCFLDIQMPRLNGFEVLARLPSQPMVIFTTAYDEYALEAFNVAALDYLLKPVSRERFSAAMERVRERLKSQPRALEQRYTRRFLVERRKAAYFLPVDSIRHIVADRNYALLHSDLGEFAIRTTIEGLEKRLDPSEFARVSRSAIVRVAAIKEVRRSEDSNCVLVMQSGEEIACSRKYWTSALEKLL